MEQPRSSRCHPASLFLPPLQRVYPQIRGPFSLSFLSPFSAIVFLVDVEQSRRFGGWNNVTEERSVCTRGPGKGTGGQHQERLVFLSFSLSNAIRAEERAGNLLSFSLLVSHAFLRASLLVKPKLGHD